PSRVFGRVGGAAIFETEAGEVLAIPAHGEQVVLAEIQIAFEQVRVLVKAAGPATGARLEIGDGLLFEGRRSGDRWNAEHHRVELGVALAVVIKEEKCAVLHDRSADIPSELVEVVTRFAQRVEGVQLMVELYDGIIGCQAAVAIELKSSTVQVVGTRLGDHVDHGAAGAPEFGRVS